MLRDYKKYFTLPFVLCSIASAAVVVDCRVVTGAISECNPYSTKFIKAKFLKYERGRQKLIVEKTLPIPPKPPIKIISVSEMIEKYVKVEDSVRFKGTEDITLSQEEKEKKIAAIYARMEKVKEARKKHFDKIKKEKESLEKSEITAVSKKAKDTHGYYIIQKGDSLSKIAERFSLKTSLLRELNQLDEKSAIKIDQKLLIPHNQTYISVMSNGKYTVKEGDMLSKIAQDFNLSVSDIVKFNQLKKDVPIRIGQTLMLPFPHTLKKVKKQRIAKKKSRVKMIRGFGKHKLRVTATAYSSHVGQTDKTPFLAAWNNHIRPGMKIIAVSRDMLTRYGLRNGSRVKIGGLHGYYTVRDKMNKRYRKRIDIYMGIDRRRALRWGRRSVILYW